VDDEDLKIARLNVSSREGRLAIMEFFYLVATPDGVRQFSERHEAALFADEEYRQAFSAANLAVDQDEAGLMGRGLYLGRPT